ncbi:cyclic nucleotide-binding protein [Paucimonas lemoignei]|uniref:Cyclic nucleotide-binding protein n=1 Tax=Paucimonas lemoignei TaxID=29443 RepID=A0A4R3HW82_PAULE|nr:cyclic nucleotide-binding domain-containing protein [Paucimonas lemoignei]TCS37537.1 cyclic nucleotide-binding protein [Paucimonas lemoignei]
MKTTETSAIAAQFQAAFPKIAGQLGPQHLGDLLDGASVQEVAPGRTLIRDRMPVDFLYFVLSGEMGAYIEQGGKSLRVGTVHSGEWLGEISVLSGEHLASATIVTDTACVVVKVHHLGFEKLITGNQAVASVLLENFIELMAKRLRATAAQA